MIASLVSLLGLLGDVMGQVDGIKVLRAMLRHRENMLNGRLPSNFQIVLTVRLRRPFRRARFIVLETG